MTLILEKNGTQTAYPHINETGGYSYYWRNGTLTLGIPMCFQRLVWGKYRTRNHNGFIGIIILILLIPVTKGIK